MYEHVTFEYVMKRMLQAATTYQPNVDTREGSIIYTALAPAAVELVNMYIELDVILQETFADTATRPYLIRRCVERNITVEPATKAIRQGEFNIDIPIGSRFSLNKLNYVAVERISFGIYKMECETEGVIGNEESGKLIPIDYIDGLTSAYLTSVLIPGEDEEDTEHLRQRYYESLQFLAYGGNIADYKQKVHAIEGVGAVKVYPVWNGGGTVKLVILDTLYRSPTLTLIDAVQTAIDPTQNDGEGLGIAPIGHVVTVVGADERIVNIATEITYQSGWDWDSISASVKEAIDFYFLELAGKWEGADYLTVRISQVETRLLDLGGVIDIGKTKFNGVAQNLQLGADEIPIRGTVTVT